MQPHVNQLAEGEKWFSVTEGRRLITLPDKEDRTQEKEKERRREEKTG